MGGLMDRDDGPRTDCDRGHDRAHRVPDLDTPAASAQFRAAHARYCAAIAELERTGDAGRMALLARGS